MCASVCQRSVFSLCGSQSGIRSLDLASHPFTTEPPHSPVSCLRSPLLLQDAGLSSLPASAYMPFLVSVSLDDLTYS